MKIAYASEERVTDLQQRARREKDLRANRAIVALDQKIN